MTPTFQVNYPPQSSEHCPTGTSWDELTKSCSNRLREDIGQPADGTCCGNPIATTTGNKYQVEADLAISPLLQFTRYYNSLSIEVPHLLSIGWTHTYTRRIEAHAGYAYVARPDGKALLFVGNGPYTTDADTVGTLERLPDNTSPLTGWRYTSLDARQIEDYDAKGRLIGITSASGESVVLIYNNGVTENNANDFRLTSVTDQQGRRLAFTYTGTLLDKITDPKGAEYLYTYDTRGNLEKVTYPGGAFRQYHYNESANTGGANLPRALTGISDENGSRFATFKYQADGRAISTEHGAGKDLYTVQYGTGSNPGATITTPLGVQEARVFATYFGVRKLVSEQEQWGANSRSKSRTYHSSNGQVATTTDYEGVVTSYLYNSRNLETQRIEAESKPGNSNPAEKRTIQTDWHATLALPIERRVYQGTASASALRAKSAWAYNARGQVTATCEISVDPLTGATQSYACGSSTDAPAGVRQTTYTYCEDANACGRIGLLTRADGPHTVPVNDRTDYSYRLTDHSGCALTPTTCEYRKGDLHIVKNALDHITEIMKYDAAGRVLESRTQNRALAAGIDYLTTQYTYHPRGWLTETRVLGPTPADDRVTTLQYDAAGQVTRVTQPDGEYLRFEYDDAHRLVRVIDPHSNKIEYTLDNAGNRTLEQVKSGSIIHRSLGRVFDALGQLQTVKNAANVPVLDYTYDGNGALESTTDAISRQTLNSLDGLGRLKQVLANATGAPAEQASTQFQYNALDQLTEVIDPNGLDTDYTYNSFGDLSLQQSPDTQDTAYTYDSAGNLWVKTDANGGTATHTYDALNRLTNVSFVKSGATTVAHAYTYDTYDVAVTDCDGNNNYSLGRLTRFTDPSGSTTFCYDRLGNMTRKTQRKGNGSGNTGLTWPVSFEYTPGGRIKKVVYPGGTEASFGFEYGEVRTVSIKPAGSSTATEVVEDTTYYPFGPLQEVLLMTGSYYDGGGGQSLLAGGEGGESFMMSGAEGSLAPELSMESGSESTLDPGMEMAASGGGGCTGPCSYQCPNGTFCRWSFNWEYDQDYGIVSAPGLYFNTDAMKRINAFTNDNGESFGVGYDDHDRISTITDTTLPPAAPVVRSFDYDATGNRMETFDGTADRDYTYYANTHRLKNTGGGTPDRQYDAAGSATSIGNIAQGYDARNRLVSVALPGLPPTHALRFEYNALGERVRKWVHRATNKDNVNDRGRYVYDEAGRLLVEEQVASGVTTASDIVWLDDRPIALVRNGGIYMIATDHLGTPRAVYHRESVELVWRWDMDADVFGNGLAEALRDPELEPVPDSDPGNNLFVFNMRYPGQLFDQETGLHYNYFRDYEPGTGRYIQSDPIGLAGGMSTYAYVGGSPLRYTDPFGLDILIQSHPVALGFDHSKVTIIPDNQARWANHPAFRNRLPDGRHFATLGAGPVDGYLVSDPNRERDIAYTLNNENAFSAECSSVSPNRSEDELIAALFAADRAYRDNLDYEFFPLEDTDGHNSNSYVSGLLRAVGLRSPTPPNTPGFDKPVPRRSFGGRP